jgi:hypothetical protein
VLSPHESIEAHTEAEIVFTAIFSNAQKRREKACAMSDKRFSILLFYVSL